MEEKKVVFIIGRLDVPKYWEIFEKVEDDLTAEGFVPLSPSRLPHNLPEEKRTELLFSMINVADAVLLTPGWRLSVLTQVLLTYAKATGKYIVEIGEPKAEEVGK